MKLPEFKKFLPFLRLKRQMGLADSAEGTIVIEKPRHILTSEELDVLISGEGIEVSFDEITILPDGTFGYKDSRVLVYIRDVIKYGNRRKEHDPRYHVMNCITLQTMRANGRFQRYVVAAELSGKFKINIIEGGRVIRSEKKRLLVCQNCLDGFGFEGFSRDNWRKTRRREFVEKFTPEMFFKKYPRSLILQLPEHTAETAPNDVYTRDSSEISRAVREERDWVCEKCGTSLASPDLRKYLHVHHVDGRKWNNERRNLRVLCIACHSEESDHGHLKSSAQYKEYIRFKRSKLVV